MNTIKTILFYLFSTLIFTSFAHSQDADDRKMSMITTFEIAPEKTAQFKSAWETIRDTAEANDYPYTDMVGSWRNTHWMVTPLKNFADVDSLMAARDAVEKAGGKAFTKAVDNFVGSMTNSHTFFVMNDSELSYWPEGAEAGPFMEIDTFHFEYGAKDEMRAILSEYKALMAEMESPYPYQVSWDSIGTEGNSVTIVSYSEDAVTLAQANAAMSEMMDGNKKSEALFDRYQKISTGTETMYGKYNAEASINPPNME